MVSNAAYIAARRNAAAHIQVLPSPQNCRGGQSTVTGTVARIFVDRTGTLSVGQRISFPQPFYTYRAPDAGPNLAAWERARLVEVYLVSYAGEWAVLCDQLTLLPATTSTPANRHDAEHWTLLEAPELWERS